jgi:hypothetical protein
MESSEENEELPQEDERGSEPPADDGSDDSQGPQGNPESDEEALSHRQQEQAPTPDD